MRKIIEVDYGSSKYEELAKLRYRVLLEPLGFNFLDAHRAKEEKYLHIVCVDGVDDKVIGGMMLAPMDNDKIRLMQVAVEEKYQRDGVGKDLVKYAEKIAKNIGYTKIVMHAMLSVVRFYEKMGYKQEGDLVEERGVTFAIMVKKL